MQDSKQIDELFRLMDDVCENGDAALPALEQYLHCLLYTSDAADD